MIDVPSAGPASLSWSAGDPLRVAVRDERGAPVPFAQLRAAPIAGDDTSDDGLPASLAAAAVWCCDAAGEVTLVQPATAHGALVLGLTQPGFLPTATHVAPDDLPGDGAPVVLTAPRASTLAGRVLDLAEPECGVRVLAWRDGEDPAAALELPLEPDGSFRRADVAAGTWHLTLLREDRTSRMARGRATEGELPVLGGGADTRATVVVDAPPGAASDALVPNLPISRIEGRVVRTDAAGRSAGVAGVAVFAVPCGDDGRTWRTGNDIGFDAADAHEYAPHAVTGPDGTFALLVARPGRFDLRARHPNQPVATAPRTVAVSTYGERVPVELDLPTASVRGCLVTASVPADAVVSLYPADAAARDPFARPAHALSDADCRLHLPIPADGTFAFDAVPPGIWVLRVRAGERVVHQRAIVVGAATVDLGAVAPARAVAGPTELPVEVPFLVGANATRLDAHVLAVLPGVPEGAFVTSVPVRGALTLPALPAGPYLVQLVDAASGRAVGAAQPLELGADGASPARLVARR